MSKIEYAKFQFMVLVLRILMLLSAHLSSIYPENLGIIDMERETYQLIVKLNTLMEEK